MSLRRKLAVIAGVYVIEGFPFGIFREVWPVYFREAGVSLATIGAVSGLYAAWSLKVLWSPLVDRFGEYRGWISAALVAMALALLPLAGFSGDRIPLALWIVLAAFCAGSATQDIAIDAYTIGLVERGEEGAANGVRITAYRVGLVAAGGLLLLAERVGWAASWGVAAAACGILALSVRGAPQAAIRRTGPRAPLAALARWLKRPGAPAVLGFVLLYRVGDLALGPMVKPFWVDRELSKDEIALVSIYLGVIATVLGAWLGAGIVGRLGIGRALWIVGFLALGSNLGYAAAAWVPESGRAGIYAASILESFCAGLAAAGFLSFLMRICEKEHAAVQYASLTALYALPGTVAGALSGRGVELLGYGSFFFATAALALPAFVLLPAAGRWLDADPGAPQGAEASAIAGSSGLRSIEPE